MRFMIKNATGQSICSLLMLSAISDAWAGCPFMKQEAENNAVGCPFMGQHLKKSGIVGDSRFRALASVSSANGRGGDGGVPEGGYEAVKQDIAAALTDSQDFFPADFAPPHGPNYGGLMIRLAWHCSGSYRATDGRGGCDGGRIRFDPESSWPDNANLDKALKILEPIKEKYGKDLSWGDLIILAGNTAIESMGGPTLGFCGGRIDDSDGANSLKLGPSDVQEAIAPCQSLEPSQQGTCLAVPDTPLGPTTVGLIYVDPAGPKGSEGDPIASGEDVRTAFSRMGFNDTETVALVGGGHAFGKCHGACPKPPCGEGTDMEGIGPNTYTSGFEGKWTTTPTTWSNQYFHNMFNFEWNLITGPGGHIQWAPSTANNSTPPDIMMLTTDLALARDSEYGPISQKYASDLSALEEDFKHAWYRLTTGDMGPVTRCLGDSVPPSQPFQHPLPTAPSTLPDFVPIRTQIQGLLDESEENTAAFVKLAYQCASTFRQTDYKGGCNGARIWFSPEADFPGNEGTQDTLATLQVIKDSFPDASWSDIIVLAGHTAIEGAGGNEMNFCGGRVDASSAANDSEFLAPRKYDPAVVSIRDDMQVKGLTARKGVALAGRPTGEKLSNAFFTNLLAGEGSFTDEERALLQAEFRPIVEEYAADEDLFKKEFASAWTKMMISDRLDGPRNNICAGVNTPTKEEGTTSAAPSLISALSTSKLFWFLLAGTGAAVFNL